jgi:hypothetical protein
MGMEYKIESGVKIPARHHRTKYPLRDMAVGDSFAIDASEIGTLRSAVSYFGLRNNRKYSIRCTDPIKREFRCWRIA